MLTCILTNEDINLNSQHGGKKPGLAACAYNYSIHGDGDRWVPIADQLNLDEMVSFILVRDPVSRQNSRECLKKIPNILPCPAHTHTHLRHNLNQCSNKSYKTQNSKTNKKNMAPKGSQPYVLYTIQKTHSILRF